MLEKNMNKYSKNSGDIITTNQDSGAYCEWINTQDPPTEQKDDGKRFRFSSRMTIAVVAIH